EQRPHGAVARENVVAQKVVGDERRGGGEAVLDRRIRPPDGHDGVVQDVPVAYRVPRDPRGEAEWTRKGSRIREIQEVVPDDASVMVYEVAAWARVRRIGAA